VLVVHSLGGLVAKKALLVSEEAYKDSLRLLHDNTVAVAFLGTPHRGGNFAGFASNIAKVLKISRKRVNDDVLKVLERDSEVLADIEESFGLWLRKKGDQVDLTCFFEEFEYPVIGTVSL
jgi:protein SERAC1